MQNDLIKQWAQLSKKANESLKKINTLNTQSVKQLTQLQMDLVPSCLEGSIKKVTSVNKVGSMTELMNLQSSLYKELSEKVLKNAQSSVKVAMETRKAMGELIQEGLAEAPSMVMTPVAKKTTPKPAARKATPKPAAPKPAAKKTPPKPAAAKKAAPKPTAKEAAPKPAVKQTAPKATARSTQLPNPSGRPVTEGDAKK
jgi:phasin family protein